MPRAASHGSSGSTRRIRPNVRTSAKHSRVPSVKRSAHVGVRDQRLARPRCTTRRPVIRRWVTRRAARGELHHHEFPPAPDGSDPLAGSSGCESTAGPGEADLGGSTSTRRDGFSGDRRVARPRAIVSTSGSSGNRPQGTGALSGARARRMPTRSPAALASPARNSITYCPRRGAGPPCRRGCRTWTRGRSRRSH